MVLLIPSWSFSTFCLFFLIGDPGLYRQEINATHSSCITCSVGYYTDDRDLPNCIGCPLGYAGHAHVFSTCESCPRGTYNSDTIAAVSVSIGCSACPVGRYSDDEGVHLPENDAIFCKACQAGSWNEKLGRSKESECILCVAGKFSETPGSGTRFACQACKGGTYGETSGAVLQAATCHQCPAGFVQSDAGKTYCRRCEGGTASGHVAGQVACAHCEFGKFRTSGMDATACHNCSAGFVQEDRGQASCLPCIPGTISYFFVSILCILQHLLTFCIYFTR